MIGQTLSHGRLLRELDRDGMGAVYEAQDVRLGRKVGVGLLPEDMARGVGRVLPMLETHEASAE